MATVIEVMAKLTGNASGMVKSFVEARKASQDTADSMRVHSGQAKEAMQGLALPAGIVAGGAVAIGVSLANMASEAEQNVGAVESVFKQYADTVKTASASAAENVGISSSAYQQFASIVGSQLKNMGVPLADVAGGTDNLIKKGADLASMFGGTTSEAIEAISSMLRGETDPIERYGVSINQAAVEAKMLSMGLTGLSGPAEKNAELQAKLAILTEQTADATGNFAREGDTAAGAMQRANAKWDDARAALGTHLLPIMTQAATALSSVSKFASENSGVVIALGGAMLGIVGSILAVNGAIAAYETWTKLATVGTFLLANAMKVIGIGLIIAAVAGIIALFSELWKTSDEFRNFWIGLWDGIQKAAAPAVKWVQDGIGQIVDSFKFFFGYLTGAGSDVKLPKDIEDWLKGLADKTIGVGNAIVDWFKGVWEGAQDLYNLLVKGDFTGLWGLEEDSGIVDFFLGIHDAAKSVWDLLVNNKATGFFGLEENVGITSFILTVKDLATDVYNLLFKGDFTGLFGMEEDNPVIDAILNIREAGQDLINMLFKGDFTGFLGLQEDSPAVAALLDAKSAGEDLYNLLFKGDFTGLFGLEEDSPVVETLLTIHKTAQQVIDILFGGNFTGLLGLDEDSPVVNMLFTVREAAINAGKFVGDLWKTFQDFLGGVAAEAHKLDIWSVLKDMGVVAFFEDIGRQVGPALQMISDAWAKVWEFISNFIGVVGPPLVAYVMSIFKMVWDAVVNVWNAVGQPLLNIIVAAWNILVGALSAVWNIIIAVVQGAMDVIFGIIKVVTGIITGNWGQVWEGICQIFGAIWDTIGKVLGEAFGFLGTLFKNGLDILTNLWNGVWGAIGGVLAAVWSNIGAVIGNAFGVIGGMLAGWLGGIWDNIVGGFNGLLGWWNGLWSGFAGMLSDWWGTIAGGAAKGADDATRPIRDIFGAIGGFLGEVFTNIGNTVSAAWKWTTDLLIAIGQAFWDTHGAQITAGWNFIVGIFTTIGNFIAGVWNGIVAAVTGYVTSMWNLIVADFTAVWNFISAILTTVWGFISSVWNSIVGAVAGAANAVWGVISSVFNTVWGFISGIFNNVLNFIRGIWNNVVGTISGAVNNVASAVRGGFNAAWGAVSSVMGQIAGFISGIWNGIVGSVRGAVGQIGGVISSIYGSVVGALSGAGSWLVNTGRNIVQGLISGVQSLAGTIGNAFLSMVPGWIVGPFKAALGIASPSKLFRRFGKWIIQGLGIGVDGEKQTAISAMEGVAADLTAAGSNMEAVAPKIVVPEVPNIAAQLALPPLTQDILLNFVGPKTPEQAISDYAATLQGAESSQTTGYNTEAMGAAYVGTQAAPAVTVNLTAKVVNPWTQEEMEVVVRDIATEVTVDGLSGTARAARSSRTGGMGGY